MKKLILSFLFLSASFIVFAQNDLILNFNHRVGTEALVSGQEYHQDELDYDFSITRLQYYISQIEIIHDDGELTAISDTWILLDAFENESYNLGNFNIDKVEEIRYWIGIDPETNHLDPTLYPEGHPLALQNPSMHWGWTAGYRFSAVEGKTGPGLVLGYEVHSLGDANYNQIKLATSNSVEENQRIITLEANYMGLYKGVDVSGGLISHSETAEAAVLLGNFSTEVFSQMMFTGIQTPLNESFNFTIAPNPATIDQAKIYIDQNEHSNLQVQVTDLSGRMVEQQMLESYQSEMKLNIKQSGIYFVNIFSGHQLIKTKKLVINQ